MQSSPSPPLTTSQGQRELFRLLINKASLTTCGYEQLAAVFQHLWHLSHGVKTFERMVLWQLRTLLTNFLDPLKFTYQPHIAVEAIVFMTHKALSQLENEGSTVRVLFFDFPSAFNTI